VIAPRLTVALWSDRRAAAGVALLVVVTLTALLGPIGFGGDDGGLRDVAARRFVPPLGHTPDGSLHLLGTDRFGRDVMERLLAGARVSLAVGGTAALVALALGVLLGGVAGYIGGLTDRMVIALTDAALAIPRVPFLLLMVALFQPGVGITVAALGLTGWMTVARLVRAEVRSARARPFVEAAHALGTPPGRVLARHILPHALAPALVAAALGVGHAITLEAGLSFLGLGVQPPTPSWGNLIASGRDAMLLAPWVALAPALAVTLVVVACSLIADALEGALAGAER
jgi:peptide/nickel transport system permease protein